MAKYSDDKWRECSDQADAYTEEGKYEEALAVFTEMANGRPDNTYPEMMKGRCLVQLNRPEEAKKCYERCIELSPEHPTAQLYIDIIPTREWSLSEKSLKKLELINSKVK